MAPLLTKLASDTRFKSIVCVTAQHREMLDQVLSSFQIKVDHDLNVMKVGQDLTDITTRILQGLRPVLSSERPDIVLVHGDTTTTICGALAAFYQQIPVGHVEAGLRTHNLQAPFPEEANRRLTSVVTNLHFAPTEEAQKNLLAEGIKRERIFVTGNTVIDSLLQAKRIIESTPAILDGFARQFPFMFSGRRKILVTCHRRENIGAAFDRICAAIAKAATVFPSCEFIFPVHPNPKIAEPANNILGKHPNVRLIAPLGYLPFVFVMSRSFLILTDSGGIQEEAPAMGIPVLVLRDTTERPDAIRAGTAKLVGTVEESILTATQQLITNSDEYEKMSTSINPFGDGHASDRIVAALAESNL